VTLYEEEEGIESEITPNNKKELYELISARGIEKNPTVVLPSKSSENDSETITDADIYFLNNSIRHLSIRKKQPKN
jgi:hypothetical protein